MNPEHSARQAYTPGFHGEAMIAEDKLAEKRDGGVRGGAELRREPAESAQRWLACDARVRTPGLCRPTRPGLAAQSALASAPACSGVPTGAIATTNRIDAADAAVTRGRTGTTASARPVCVPIAT